jgi:hypothetical protein
MQTNQTLGGQGAQRGSAMRKLLLLAASFLLSLSLFFGATGVVFDEGGFGVRLVLKPGLSSEVAFGGGEDGQWQRHHPGEPLPWWQQANLSVLLDGDWEEGVPAWVELYRWGFVALALLGWPTFALTVLWVLLRRLSRYLKMRAGELRG